MHQSFQVQHAGCIDKFPLNPLLPEQARVHRKSVEFHVQHLLIALILADAPSKYQYVPRTQLLLPTNQSVKTSASQHDVE